MITHPSPLPEVVAAMLGGDFGAAVHFVPRQQPSQVPPLVVAAGSLHDITWHCMLRDQAAFMAFKTPDPLPRLPSELFRRCLELAMEPSRHDEIPSLLADQDLAVLYVLLSLCSRIKGHDRKAVEDLRCLRRNEQASLQSVL